MGKLIRFRRKGKAKKDEAARSLFPPIVSGAPDARSGAFSSDASTSADGSRAGASPDPEIERRNVRRQRSVILALTIVFIGGTAAALFGDRGYLDVNRKRLDHRELRAAHAIRLQRVEALRRNIESLRTDPFAIERIAREDLGYVAKNELTLLLPGDDPWKPRGLDAKIGSGIVPVLPSTP